MKLIDSFVWDGGELREVYWIVDSTQTRIIMDSEHECLTRDQMVERFKGLSKEMTPRPIFHVRTICHNQTIRTDVYEMEDGEE